MTAAENNHQGGQHVQDQATDSLPPNAAATDGLRKITQEHLAQLARREKGTLEDVHRKMTFSRLRLLQEHSDNTTRDAQADIVAMLTNLIQESESREAGGKSGASGGSVGGNPQGNSTAAQPTQRRALQSSWADLRDRDREARVFSAMKGKLPARYRQLVEQYYRSLQDEPRQ